MSLLNEMVTSEDSAQEALIKEVTGMAHAGECYI